MDRGDWTTIIVAIIAALPGLVALYESRKKNEAEAGKVEADAEKIKAETESIHAQVADRWAEHVAELMGRVEKQDVLIKTLLDEREKDKAEIRGLRLDIAQVRRANEDLKDWAERLNCQFITHLPDIEPEKFIRRPKQETQPLYTQE